MRGVMGPLLPAGPRMPLQRPITPAVHAALHARAPWHHLDTSICQSLLATGALLDFEDGERVEAPDTTATLLGYVLEGTVETSAGLHLPGGTGVLDLTADAGSGAAFGAAGRARGETRVLWIPQAALDAKLAQQLVGDEGRTTDARWVGRLLRGAPFNRLPREVVRQIFARLEPGTCASGEFLIREGEAGAHYFILAEGRAMVSREPGVGGTRHPLAVLGPGDAFGEEALLAGIPRNASIAMLGPGRVMRLNHADFDALLRDTLLHPVAWSEAVTRVVRGQAAFIDVRAETASRTKPFPAAQAMPLRALRALARKLDPSTACIACCEDGSRSAAAAFILAGMGFEAEVLSGGLDSVDAAALLAVRRSPSRGPAPASAPALAVAGDTPREDELTRLRRQLALLEAENVRLRAALGTHRQNMTAAGAPTAAGVPESSPESGTEGRQPGIASSRTLVQAPTRIPLPSNRS